MTKPIKYAPWVKADPVKHPVKYEPFTRANRNPNDIYHCVFVFAGPDKRRFCHVGTELARELYCVVKQIQKKQRAAEKIKNISTAGVESSVAGPRGGKETTPRGSGLGMVHGPKFRRSAVLPRTAINREPNNREL